MTAPFDTHVLAHRQLGIQHHAYIADHGRWRDHCRADTDAADIWRNRAQVCCCAEPHNLGFLGIELKALGSTVNIDVGGTVIPG